MSRKLAWWLRIAVPTVAVAALVIGLFAAGAFSKKGDGLVFVDHRPVVGAPGVKLISFDTCQSALNDLRAATMPLVTAYGLGGGRVYPMEDAGGVVPPGAPKAADSGAAAGAPTQQAPPEHSTTNTHEAGVDEPDVVKTDGKRLLSVVDGRLRVLDVASHKQTAVIDLPSGPATQLLINGDRALVLASGRESFAPDPTGGGAQLVLVDLAAAKVIGTLSVEGAYLDARQVGPVARVVVRSAPHLNFVYPDAVRSADEALLRNRELVGRAPISDWLPRYSLEQNGKSESGQLVECSDVRRPESYTGTSMLTVLTLDLSGELGKGDPVSIAADGDTVYGTGSSLYIADDRMQHMITEFAPAKPMPGGPRMPPLPAQRTSIYQFDISQPGKPVFLASGGVDGTLLNQYAMSEFGNNLRVATTSQQQTNLCCDQPGKSESFITVLTRKGNELAQLGKVGGLGVGERIYAVRFIGPVGYVVTFRQTDPLYTVDLSDPAKPRVAGQLKITGYSAYLHPAGDGKLIGVGQEATEQGRRTGLQVSLFDTGNLSAAQRIAQFQLTGGQSEVDFDPHAFLYWPAKGLLVVPVMPQWRGEPGKQDAGGALVLKVDGGTLSQVGTITHPLGANGYPDGTVRRSAVIGDELWTVSQGGAMANALDGLAQRAWIPFA